MAGVPGQMGRFSDLLGEGIDWIEITRSMAYIKCLGNLKTSSSSLREKLRPERS
jgi:hypothetical protein